MKTLGSLKVVDSLKNSLKIFGDSSDPLCKDGSIDDTLKNLAGFTETGTIKDPVLSIVQTILLIGGILAVVMIIIAGVQMTTSAGNSAAVAKAKNTLMWAIVGLIVIVLAYAIVSFVLARL